MRTALKSSYDTHTFWLWKFIWKKGLSHTNPIKVHYSKYWYIVREYNNSTQQHITTTTTSGNIWKNPTKTHMTFVPLIVYIYLYQIQRLLRYGITHVNFNLNVLWIIWQNIHIYVYVTEWHWRCWNKKNMPIYMPPHMNKSKPSSCRLFQLI